MNTRRRSALIVGVLYIIGTLGGILSLVLTEPVRDAQDLLSSVSANESQMITGALCVLTMGLALALIPVVAFPVLRKHNEVLALGYVVFRSGLEAVTHIAIVISWLLLVSMSQLSIQAGLSEPSSFQALGALLLEADEIGSIGTIVFSLGALMFYTVLYQSKLVPRWLSGWGLIAITLYLAAGLLVIFSLISPLSTVGVVLDFPLAVQEMVLAVWLIVKGFNPSAVGSEPASQVLA